MLCGGTLLGADYRELLEAAVAGGFQAVSLWPRHYRSGRAAGHSDADLRALLADHGLVVADLDPLLTWLPAGVGGGIDPGPFAEADEREFFAIAEAVGARSLNAAQAFGATIDVDGAAEAFAGLCTRAREHGLGVTLEFLPWTGIRDVAVAAEIAERAGQPNGAVMLDTWHWFRGGADPEPLRRLDGARIGGVQINDAPADAPDDPVRETMEARRLPGAGDIDLPALIGLLDEIGSRAPIGVEVFSTGLAALPPPEVGRRCGEAARAVLQAARD
ncbi:MAG: sugar phosphate isomerase/epimerase [Myxococcota bacterium]|nr:sugar phosphate isomerase/epimerase [Myxococcota bacterium]